MLDAAPQLGWAMIAGMVGVAIVMLLKPRVVAFVARRRHCRRVRRLLADSPYSSRPMPRGSFLDRLIEWADAHYPDTERRRLR